MGEKFVSKAVDEKEEKLHILRGYIAATRGK
jgi:hypothetical protein